MNRLTTRVRRSRDILDQLGGVVDSKSIVNRDRTVTSARPTGRVRVRQNGAMKLVPAAVALVMMSSPFPRSAAAQADWLEYRSAHYSVFYRTGFERDLAFARTWADRAERLMKDKYAVPADVTRRRSGRRLARRSVGRASQTLRRY